MTPYDMDVADSDFRKPEKPEPEQPTRDELEPARSGMAQARMGRYSIRCSAQAVTGERA